MIPGGAPERTNIGHMDTAWLVAESTRMGKPLHVRAITGALLLVLDIGADMELTADYWAAS